MDEEGTKVLLKQQKRLKFNRILPTETDADFAPSERSREEPDVNEIEWVERSEQAPPLEETLPQFDPLSEKLMEGQVERWNEKSRSYDQGYYIELH